MIWAANSKQRSMRSARMWNRTSPGVATAWRVAARISRNGCNSAGRGWPKSWSHAADPNAMMQVRFPLGSRNPTERKRAASSAHSDRTATQLAAPGLIVTTRKIAARVSNVATGCGIGLEFPAASGVVIGSDSIRWCPGEACGIPRSAQPRQPESGQNAERNDGWLSEDPGPDLRTERDDRLLDHPTIGGEGPRDDPIGARLAQTDHVLDDLVDGAGQGEGGHVAVGDQRQQRQIGLHPGGVGRPSDGGQG